MSSSSISHLIMFIAGLIVSVSIAGTIMVQVGGMATAIEDRGAGLTEEIETDIAIVSDPSNTESVYDDGTVTIYVKNTGSTDLAGDGSSIDVFIDGGYIGDDDLDVDMVSGGSAWRSDDVAEITVTDQDLSGDTEFAIIANGNEETIDFHA